MGMMEQEQESGQGGYCIKIHMSADNQIRAITTEADYDDKGIAEANGSPMTPDEALAQIRQILEGGGLMGESGAQPEESPEDAMMRGYQGPSGQRRGMGVNKVFDKGRM